MRSTFLKFVMALAVLAGVRANAEPYIDPALMPLWTQASTSDTRPIVLIVMFKDLAPAPKFAASTANHAYAMAALRNNAMVSQKATLERLQSFIASGTQVAGSQIWLMNGLVLQIPVNKMKQLALDPNVTGIHANHPAHLIMPRRARVRAGGQFTYGLTKIGIPEIRSRNPQLNGNGVRVGVLDTGIDPTHPDLKDRLIGFKSFVGGSQSPSDEHGHGTHVSGTIAGGGTSGTEIGVAPGAKLIHAKIFDGNGSGSTAGILQAMQWVVDPDGNPQTPDHPHLVSNSWGGPGPAAGLDPMDTPYCKAVNGWVKMGVLPVFAAGNSGPRPKSVGLPGACPESLTVGATDENDNIADFSSRGPVVWKSGEVVKPNVSAPGVNVLSSIPGGKYDSWDGTSMATPHVAGLAALMYQVNPKMTYEQSMQLIMSRAKDLGKPGNDNDFGMGRIDAVNTLKSLLNWVRGLM